jgi:hypothetical protein
MFRSECTKNIIILDCVNAIHSHPTEADQSPIPPDPDHIEACHGRLESWWQARPLSLRPELSPLHQHLLFAYVRSWIYCVGKSDFEQDDVPHDCDQTLPTDTKLRWQQRYRLMSRTCANRHFCVAQRDTWPSNGPRTPLRVGQLYWSRPPCALSCQLWQPRRDIANIP